MKLSLFPHYYLVFIASRIDFHINDFPMQFSSINADCRNDRARSIDTENKSDIKNQFPFSQSAKVLC